MQSKAATVKEYLAQLPSDRRQAIEALRAVILENLDAGFEEGMQYGMIGYYVPHSTFPAGYHCDPKQPLPFAGLASQKNYMSLYMMSEYGDEGADDAFRAKWAKTGKKLDMGKCCIRFKRFEDLAIDVIADALKRMTARGYIAHYESCLTMLNQRASKGPPEAAATKGVVRPTAVQAKASRPAAKPRAAKSGSSGPAQRAAAKKKSPAKAARRTK